MKKYILYVFYYILIISSNLLANPNEDDPNVLSYYAVGNVLDGQPLVDSENLLRFYPVFKFREVTTSVKVTVYYGSLVYTRNADQKDEGRYWEVLLPHFNLGESIQRLDVETHFYIIDDKFITFQDLLKKQEDEVQDKFNEFSFQIEKSRKSLTQQINDFESKIISKSEKIDNLTITESNELLQEIKSDFNIDTTKLSEIKKLTEESKALISVNLSSNELISNKLTTIKQKLQDALLSINAIDNIIKSYNLTNSNFAIGLADIKNALEESKTSINTSIDTNIRGIDQIITDITARRKKLEKEYKEELVVDINNKLAGISKQAGPSITESDIIIQFDNVRANVKVLYRNYKKELRQLVALDPAEKMGIFRLRYIPFPIIGNKLYKPFTATSISVFEVGLGFGNVPVSGDEFVKPTLSFDRLGVAFAISNQLFSDSAQVLALVLTYDFNVYGSIGVGANFKSTGDPDSDNVQPYYSFGINKKAFELLVASLGKFFGIN